MATEVETSKSPPPRALGGGPGGAGDLRPDLGGAAADGGGEPGGLDQVDVRRVCGDHRDGGQQGCRGQEPRARLDLVEAAQHLDQAEGGVQRRHPARPGLLGVPQRGRETQDHPGAAEQGVDGDVHQRERAELGGCDRGEPAQRGHADERERGRRQGACAASPSGLRSWAVIACRARRTQTAVPRRSRRVPSAGYRAVQDWPARLPRGARQAEHDHRGRESPPCGSVVTASARCAGCRRRKEGGRTGSKAFMVSAFFQRLVDVEQGHRQQQRWCSRRWRPRTAAGRRAGVTSRCDAIPFTIVRSVRQHEVPHDNLPVPWSRRTGRSWPFRVVLPARRGPGRGRPSACAASGRGWRPGPCRRNGAAILQLLGQGQGDVVGGLSRSSRSGRRATSSASATPRRWPAR